MDIFFAIIDLFISSFFPHIKYFDDKKKQSDIENHERYSDFIQRAEDFRKNDPISKFLDKFFS